MTAATALLLALAAAPLAPLPGRDTVPADTVYRVGPVRVTVLRTSRPREEVPLALSVVEGAEIRLAERAVSLAEELQAVPGVWVQNRHNLSLGDRITVRGTGSRAQFGVRGIQVVVDGVPFTLPDGQAVLTNLDLGSVGRIEVLRGAASSLYGNASGGVIRVETRTPPPGPPRAALRVLGGSDGFLRAEAEMSGASGGTGWLVHGSHFRTDGFRAYGAAETYRLNGVLRTELDPGTEFRAVASAFHTPFAENPSSLAREDAARRPTRVRSLVLEQGLGEEGTQAHAGVTLEHRFGPANGGASPPDQPGSGAAGPRRGPGVSTVRATGWALRRSVWNPIPFRIIDLDRIAGGLRSELRGSLAADPFPVTWTAGADAGLQRDRRREHENAGVPDEGGRTREGALLQDQRELVLNVGPFAQLEARPGEDWLLVAGARMDAYRFDVEDRRLEDGDDSGTRTMSAFSPMFGVVWTPVAWLEAFANHATAFQTPTTSELSNRPSGGGGFDPRLGPATSRSLEAGLRGTLAGGRVRFDVTAFRVDVDDALVPREGATGETFFRNAGRVTRRGVEAALGWRPVPDANLRLAYTRQSAGFDRFVTASGDFSGNREPGIPPHRLTLEAVGHGPGGLRTEVDFRWVDAYAVDDANTGVNPSHRVVDLRLSLDVTVGGVAMRPQLGVDNLLDERYNASIVPNAFGGRYYEPAPGRTWYGGVRVALGGR